MLIQYGGNYGMNYLNDKPKQAFSFRTAESFLQSVSENSNVDLDKFKIGKTVEHKKFGVGEITNVEPEDDDLKVDILFEKAGKKRLMAKFANLKVME